MRSRVQSKGMSASAPRQTSQPATWRKAVSAVERSMRTDSDWSIGGSKKSSGMAGYSALETRANGKNSDPEAPWCSLRTLTRSKEKAENHEASGINPITREITGPLHRVGKAGEEKTLVEPAPIE
jgi:hypothetical protein